MYYIRDVLNGTNETVAEEALSVAPPIKSLSVACPGSKAWFGHASAQVIIKASAQCWEVREEIIGRVTAQLKVKGGWHDPANSNASFQTYKILKAPDSDNKISLARTTPGLMKWLDLINIELILDPKDSHCFIHGCSASQSSSMDDFHTNYCNIVNLIYTCNANKRCKPQKHSFETREVEAYSSCGKKDFHECLKYASA